MSVRVWWRRKRRRCEQCGELHVSYFCPNCQRDLYHSARTVIDPDDAGLVAAYCMCGVYSRWDFDSFPMPVHVP